jgi:hypothetical protein
LQPVTLAFAFDRDKNNEYFLTKEEKAFLFPRPASWGQAYTEPTTQQLKATRQAEKERKLIQARFPLLADEL